MITLLVHILFWISFLLVIHSYIIYPLIVLVWASAKESVPPGTTSELPSISLLMSVYNEEKVIAGKLRNLAGIEYPREKIEILIGSDCSADNTLQFIESLAPVNTRIFHFEERRGKTAVLNDLAAAAKNDILVFSDANTFYYPDALEKMALNFSDHQVGGVCGNLSLEASATNSGGVAEAAYWRYENAIKQSEGKIKTTFGATGAIYAIRRELFKPLRTDRLVADDFLIPLHVVRMGYRIQYEAGARCWEETGATTGNEFQRKIRIGAAIFNGLPEIIPLLHPRHGFISFGLVSHKLIRWIVPYLLMVLFLTSIWLSGASAPYRWFLYGQLLFVCLAVIGYILDRRNKPIMFFTMPYYFMVANAGLLAGFVRFLRGTQKAVWSVKRR